MRQNGTGPIGSRELEAIAARPLPEAERTVQGGVAMSFLQLARSAGRGASMFLARSMRDIHSAGGLLCQVRFAVGRSGGWTCVFDHALPAFDYAEEIRVDLDRHGRVRSAETWRKPGHPARPRYRHQRPLAEALSRAVAISAIQLDRTGAGGPHPRLRLSLSPGGSFVLDFGDFLEPLAEA